MAGYRIDVRPFLDEIGGGVEVSDTLELDELIVGDNRFVPAEPPVFRVSVSNAGEALVAVGTITARMKTECSRCLCETETTIVGDVEGLWPRPGQEAPEDQDLTGEVDMDGTIDLEPALVAALVVEAPFAPLHDEECAGLCTVCGADLNHGSCACETATSDEHPFAALQNLRLDDEGEESDVSQMAEPDAERVSIEGSDSTAPDPSAGAE